MSITYVEFFILIIREQTKIDWICTENAFLNQRLLKNALSNTQLNIYKGLDLHYLWKFQFFFTKSLSLANCVSVHSYYSTAEQT